MTKNLNSTIVGWVSSSTDRGTVDVAWSCCITIFLCVWVSTYPNIPSRNDKWYHCFLDKLNLAFIGFLGPDFLFGIAIGQHTSAWRSVQMFRDSPELRYGQEWTMTHAFFADMGGFLLASPDYPQGFPINAEQLYYLVKHGHLDYPMVAREEIESWNKTDSLSKIITVWQVLWFTITEFQRLAKGYPMTTLELTALTFSCVMVATSIALYHKPSITRATILHTKGGLTIREIRDIARNQTHPELPSHYYRTPLDFISRRKFKIDTHWAYYSQLTHMVHLPLFNRQIKTTPWDRFPSDQWCPPGGWMIPFGLAIHIPFSLAFLPAWNFHFPTPTEQLIWRICSVFHAAFSLFGAGYYTFLSFTGGKDRLARFRAKVPCDLEDNPRSPVPSGTPQPRASLEEVLLAANVPIELPISHQKYIPEKGKIPRSMSSFRTWLDSWRNISPDQDPDMEMALRWTWSIFIPSFVYILCRLYFYVEDFAGLRAQPAGVYQTVNRFLPFL